MATAHDMRKWRRRAAQYGGSTMTDRTRIDPHLRALRERGWTWRALEQHLGINHGGLLRRERVLKDTEQRILAVSLDMEPPRPGYVDAKPVARHIKALRAAGWTLASIADEAQVQKEHLSRVALLKGQGPDGVMRKMRSTLADRIMAIELPPIRSEDVDEVVVMRLVDPAYPTVIQATPAEMSAAIDIVTERCRVNRSNASTYINHRRHLLNGQRIA